MTQSNTEKSLYLSVATENYSATENSLTLKRKKGPRPSEGVYLYNADAVLTLNLGINKHVKGDYTAAKPDTITPFTLSMIITASENSRSWIILRSQRRWTLAFPSSHSTVDDGGDFLTATSMAREYAMWMQTVALKTHSLSTYKKPCPKKTLATG